ncbi:MAG: glycosyltransferase family 4 protein [Chloroflexota bacterium]
MKVVMVSKALVIGTYRQKLAELVSLGIDLTAVVPTEWKEGGRTQVLEPATDDGYSVIPLPVRLNGHFHLHYYPKLRKILRRISPDLVHVDEEPYNLATYLAVRSARSLQIRSLFFTWQNLARYYPPPFSWWEQSVYRHVSAAIAGNNEAVEVLRRKGYVGPCTVIPQFGVDPSVFSPTQTGHGAFVVGLLNRLIPGKAPLLAIEAFATLPPEAHLMIVGDGPLRSEVERKIRDLNLQSRVVLQHRVPSAQLPDLLRRLDVVLLPSISTATWKEQFGRVLVESMACGVPVIGSDSGEIPRVIGDAGIVVPEGNCQALSSALQQLYHDHSLRERLASVGRSRVLEYFTNASIARRTREAYLAALSS